MNLRNPAFAVISGLLLAASFPLFDIHILAWIALVPLFSVLKGKSLKEGFWLGGVFGVVFFTGTVYWVTNSVHFYGGIPLIPASFITLLLCAYLALYTAVFGAALVHLRNHHPSLVVVTAPALWTTLELARTYVFTGFPWSLLGYSQYSLLPVIQIADITGVYGISFLIVMVNAAIADFILSRKISAGLLAALVVTASILGYGWTRIHTQDSIGGMTVSVVQGNIEQDKKWDPAYQADTIAIYKRLTINAMKQHPDLVIWPETSTPFYFTGARESDRILSDDLRLFVKQNKVPLLFGSPTFEIKPDRAIIGRNSAFLLSPDGVTSGVYHKMHLVPFGEFVPLKKLLFFVEKMVEAIGDFQSGNEYTVMTMPAVTSGQAADVKFSTVICYEIIFPDLVRQFVNNGAEIVTTVTNDAWFGKTAAPYQHFSMAVFRAVENRVPVARAANTGVSGFIDSKGHILATSNIFAAASLTQRIIPGAKKTFYTRYGDIFSYACVLFTLALLAIKPRASTPG
jgi:apolipoprotein N-acyltransferase